MGKCKEYETAKNAQGARKYIGNLYFVKKNFSSVIEIILLETYHFFMKFNHFIKCSHFFLKMKTNMLLYSHFLKIWEILNDLEFLS